ncbi:methyl-accepting chemotaxis protein [Desulfitobacterium chlororespirans]|uniref:Methyl-accepting chemotaxis protein n=1 Tax=Desulfitobacterium chlororespirans DSM 11544 TaxID=1121395 RepID=A0A1M7UFX9_9FIRM|nr:methyl-accepting chemotaxis protein [Desulfitobacterium chlororespirans]SHN81913.1 methyl-accepting chemotaxis protein [Desulfitobacterium chlororespirans DSM 11544]
MKSIGNRIALIFAGVLIVSTTALSLLAYVQASQVITREVSSATAKLAEEAANTIETAIEKVYSNLEVLANSEVMRKVGEASPATIQQQVAALKEEAARSGFLLMSITDATGKSHTSNNLSLDNSQSECFLEAMQGKRAISPVQKSSATDTFYITAFYITFTVPIKSGDQVIGTIDGVLDVMDLTKLAEELTIGQTGYVFIVNEQGTVIAHPDKELVEGLYNPIAAAQEDPGVAELADVIQKRMLAGENGSSQYVFQGQEKMMGFAPVENTKWSLALTAPMSEILSALDGLKRSALIIALFFLVFGTIVAIAAGRRIARPVNEAAAYAEMIAEGDLTQKLSQVSLARRDEIGRLSQSFQKMQDVLNETVGKISISAANLATASRQLSRVTQNASANMETIAAATEEIFASLEEVSASSQEVAASGQEMNASTETLNKAMVDGGENSRTIENRVGTVYQSVTASKQITEQTYSTLEERIKVTIEKAGIVDEITNMADLIANIAGQTNLLALNAAIEAARAGEQGRGFAVVAEEVRKLAEQSANTVENIQEVTNKVRESIDDLVKQAQELLAFMNTKIKDDYVEFMNTAEQYREDTATFGRITRSASEMCQQVLLTVSEVSRAMTEITQSVGQSAESSQQVASSIETATVSMTDISTSVDVLAKTAEELTALTGKFTL